MYILWLPSITIFCIPFFFEDNFHRDSTLKSIIVWYSVITKSSSSIDLEYASEDNVSQNNWVINLTTIYLICGSYFKYYMNSTI